MDTHPPRSFLCFDNHLTIGIDFLMSSSTPCSIIASNTYAVRSMFVERLSGKYNVDPFSCFFISSSSQYTMLPKRNIKTAASTSFFSSIIDTQNPFKTYPVFLYTSGHFSRAWSVLFWTWASSKNIDGTLFH